jgi:hypothetical protein
MLFMFNEKPAEHQIIIVAVNFFFYLLFLLKLKKKNSTMFSFHLNKTKTIHFSLERHVMYVLFLISKIYVRFVCCCSHCVMLLSWWNLYNRTQTTQYVTEKGFDLQTENFLYFFAKKISFYYNFFFLSKTLWINLLCM